MRDTTYYYTDGACSGNPGAGGWAFIELSPTKKGYSVHTESGNKENATNNEMELTGVYKALVRAYKNKAKKVTIICDSAYCVNAVNMGWLVSWSKNEWTTKEGKPIKNKHIWENIYKLLFIKRMNVTFLKVKGHIGDPMNELADDLAVQARKEIE